MIVAEEDFGGPAAQALLAEVGPRTGGSAVQASDFEPPHGVFVIAREASAPVGCGGLRRLDDRTGEVKRLFVRPQARGRGVGRAVLVALEQWARARAYEVVRLDTDGGHPAALALFESAGYQRIADYNGNPFARWWFEKQLR